jgi:hypothetical protein
MSHAPALALLSLLASEKDAEHVYAASEPLDDVSPERASEIEDSFHAQYEDVVRQIAASWGPPDFNDGMGSSEFPSWYEAEFLSTWAKGNRIAYVALLHADQELPYAVVYGVRTGVPAFRPTKARRNLAAESARLSTTFARQAVHAVRFTSKFCLVLEFTNGSFLTIEAAGNALRSATGRGGSA